MTARRPLCGVLLAALSGALAGFSGAISAGVALPLAWLVVALGCSPRAHRFRSAAIFAAVLLLAAAHSAMSLFPKAPDHLRNQMRRPIEHLELSGYIADDPVDGAGRHPPTRVWQFPFRVERIRRAEQWQRGSGMVWVSIETESPRTNYRYGERLLLSGNVAQNPAPIWSKKALSLRLDQRFARRLAGSDGGNGFMRQCLKGRRWCARHLAIGIEDQVSALALIRALVLGYRHELPKSAREAFARTGTMHIVAISGAHVAMVAWLLLAAIRMVGISLPRWPVVLAPLLLLYACSTGMSPSTLRACTMALCFYAAPAVWRQPDSLSALAFSALLLLAINPVQLASPGFILSYAVVSGLILLYPPVRDFLLNLALSPDPSPATTRFAQWSQKAKRRVIDLFAVTAVAWAISTPLIAFWFNLVSPIALLANLFVVPLAFLILFAAALSLGIGWIHPILAEIYNRAAAVFCNALFALIDWHGTIPFGYFRVESPPIAWVLLVTLLVFAAVLGTRPIRRAAAVVLVATCLGWVGLWLKQRERVVAIRHLGPAAVAHIRAPGGGDWLLDTGPAYTASSLERFLAQRGVNRLRGVILMRASTEAGGALPALVERGWVDEVWAPDAKARSRPFLEMLRQVDGRGVPIKRFAADLNAQTNLGALHVRMLHPERGGSYPNALAGGLALHLSDGAASLLALPGYDRDLQSSILGLPADIGSRVIVELAVQSRSEQGENAAWLDALRPAWIVRAASVADRYRLASDSIGTPPLRARVIQIQPEETLVLRMTAAGIEPDDQGIGAAEDVLDTER